MLYLGHTVTIIVSLAGTDNLPTYMGFYIIAAKLGSCFPLASSSLAEIFENDDINFYVCIPIYLLTTIISIILIRYKC